MSDIPWTYSEAFQQHFVYDPRNDELVFRDGERMRRPATLPVAALEAATYVHGASNYSQSPPTGGSSYTLNRATGTTQREPAIQQREPQRSSATDPREDLATRMARVRLNAANIPRGLLARTANDQELMANVVVRQTSGPSNPEISQAEVLGGDRVTERLYPEYKLRPRAFFFVGKIFSILWSEPAGATSKSTVITSREEAVIEGPYGEAIFSKIRRFVVIRQGDGYCNALPISTYGGRGVGKKGVVKSEHAIIYTNPLPRPMPGERPGRTEEPMRPIAIRVDPDTKAEKLDDASRVNFGHPHTIQYNVKVKSCGKVPQECLRDLVAQFANVFNPADLGSSGHGQAGSSRVATGFAAEYRPAAAPESTASDPRPAATSYRTTAGPSSAATETRSATTSSRSADDTVTAALTKLMEGMSRDEAIWKMLAVLEAKGINREQALEMIKKALVASSS